MGKADNRKWELEFRNMTGTGFSDFTHHASIAVLLVIGKLIASTDYAVRFYYNKNHPKFHTNRQSLEGAVRHAWDQGAFDHRKQVIELIKRDFSSLIKATNENADEISEE